MGVSSAIIIPHCPWSSDFGFFFSATAVVRLASQKVSVATKRKASLQAVLCAILATQVCCLQSVLGWEEVASSCIIVVGSLVLQFVDWQERGSTNHKDLQSWPDWLCCCVSYLDLQVNIPCSNA